MRRSLWEQLKEARIEPNEPFDPEPTVFEERIAVAFQVIVPQMVRSALEHLNRMAEFSPVPGDHLPQEAPVILAFGSVVGLSIGAGITREGYMLPVLPIIELLPRSIFYGWPAAEIEPVVKIERQLRSDLFRKKEHPVIKEWIEDCSMLTSRYLENQAAGDGAQVAKVVTGCGILINQLLRATAR